MAELQADFLLFAGVHWRLVRVHWPRTAQDYKSHAATIRRWAKRQGERARVISDLFMQEGESLMNDFENTINAHFCDPAGTGDYTARTALYCGTCHTPTVSPWTDAMEAACCPPLRCEQERLDRERRAGKRRHRQAVDDLNAGALPTACVAGHLPRNVKCQQMKHAHF